MVVPPIVSDSVFTNLHFSSARLTRALSRFTETSRVGTQLYMKIDFTRYQSVVDAIELSSWTCIEEADIAPKLPVDPDRKLEIRRVYEMLSTKAEIRFGAGYEIAMASDRIQADLFPRATLNSIEIIGKVCSRTEALKLAHPIIESWELFSSKLAIRPNEELPFRDFFDATDTLITWLDDFEIQTENEPFIADSKLQPDPRIRFLRLGVFFKGKERYIPKVTCYWGRSKQSG